MSFRETYMAQTIKHQMQCEKCLGYKVKKNGFEQLSDSTLLQKWYCIPCKSSLTRVKGRRNHALKTAKANKVIVCAGMVFTRHDIQYVVGERKAVSQYLGQIWSVSGSKPGSATWMYEDSIFKALKR